MPNQSNGIGQAVIAIVIAILVLLAVAFALGGAISDQLQLLNSDIAKAIANMKQQQALTLELTNDQLQETIRGQKIANDKQQAQADVDIANQRALSGALPQLLQTLVGGLADMLRIISTGLAVASGYLLYRRYGNGASQPVSVQKPVLRFRQAATATRTFAFEVEQTAALIPSPAEAPVTRPLTLEELRRLRKMARHHEIEYRQALIDVQADQGDAPCSD